MVGQTIPILDLFIYTSDLEDYNYELAFSIESQSDTGVISCTVTGNGFLQCGNAQEEGYSDITVKVTDTGGLSDTDTFRITMQGPANTPPMISGIPDYTIDVGEAIPSTDLFGYAFDQQDSDSELDFSIDSQSDGSVASCTIASNRYVQCGTGQKAGFSDIIVRATDTGGLSDTDIFRITVQAAPPANTPPVISGLPDFTINAGETISLLDLFGYASDSQDADSALSFSVDSQSDPSVISCYVTGNRYVGCGSSQASGYNDITVRVTDTGGLSDTDTFRITVQGQPPQQNRPPVMDSIIVTPASPQDADDLTCTVQVSDQDGNLDRVQFKWFVNGGLDRTKVTYASGSSATVQDSLLSSRSVIGDEVRCEAAVYDSAGNQASGYDSVIVEMQGCGVDVSNLEVVDNNKIRFRIRNTAQGSESISYQVLVDGAVVAQSSITLASNELEIIQAGYTFGIGSYIVKVKATANCGAVDSESLIHQVLDPCPDQPSCPGPQPGNDDPVIDLVRISPSDPDDGDDLTCRVEVSDDDGDLDRVQIKWLVDGFTERTRTIYVNGNDDAAQDMLGSGFFNRGDEVRCDARVFDDEGNEDSDSDVVFIGGEQGCGVDVYSLELIDDNIIRFRIRNTGDDSESVNYKIYVEDEVIIERNIFLDDGEWDSIEESFSFDISDSLVKIRVKADCGASDTEYLSGDGSGMCQNKYLNEYRCSGSWLQRKYQYTNCDTIWVNSEYCSSGCSGSSCIGTGTGQCGVSVQRFEYQTSIVSGNAAYVTLEARNTASNSETITLSIWVDGQLRDSYSSTVSQGMTLMKTFYYYPSAGTHQILAKAETNCGSSDTRTATVTVLQSGQPTPYPYYPTPQPAPALPTAVSIYPSSLETSLCSAAFVTIDIHNSVEQVYTIQVTGVPSDWVSYQSQNIVKAGDRQLFVYVEPKEVGTHSITVTVTTGIEKKTYQQDVSIYTAPVAQAAGAEGWSITGSLIEASQNPAFWIVLIIIAGAIVVIVGATRLKPDEEYYEPYYPYRRYRPLQKGQSE